MCSREFGTWSLRGEFADGAGLICVGCVLWHIDCKMRKASFDAITCVYVDFAVTRVGALVSIALLISALLRWALRCALRPVVRRRGDPARRI